MMDTVLVWAEKNRKRWLGDLKNWLSIASVSAQPEHEGDMKAAAEWAKDYLRTIGMQVEVIATQRHPCLLATTPDSMCAGDAPHVLLYGHYDVQPAEPLELWKSPPFTPTVREEKLFARGACDDKGQVHCHMAALAAWKEIDGGFPCRVTILLEGEEEIGSPNLMEVVRSKAEFLRTAKVLIISDTSQFAAGVPSITYGLRGLAYFELKLKGAETDLHSGVYGGAVVNPAQVLAEVMAKMHDRDGRVTVPGFYEDVVELSAAERAEGRKLPGSEEELAQELGMSVAGLVGEKGYTSLERKTARPTLEINGLTSGYQGAGAKTVLPCEASVKFSCRLVPNQDPGKITRAVEGYVRSLLPAGVTAEFHVHGAGSPPAITPMDSPAMQAAAEALEIGYGVKPIFIREGGSIPVVAWFKEALGLDTIMVGFGLPGDHLHAPNEKLDLACYFGGIRTAAALYERLGERLK